MKNKTLILIVLFIFAVVMTNCDKRGYDDEPPSAVWGQNIDGLYGNGQIQFGNFDIDKIHYSLFIEEKFECTNEEFEIIGNIESFSDWNECNIKFPSDTPKKWLFKLEGKNIPKNISFLYDVKNNIGDTLIFWDSDTTKYYFIKQLIY